MSVKLPVVYAKNGDWAEGFDAGYTRAIEDWMIPKWEAGPVYDPYFLYIEYYYIRCRIFKHEQVWKLSPKVVESMKPELLKEMTNRILASTLLGAFGLR